MLGGSGTIGGIVDGNSGGLGEGGDNGGPGVSGIRIGGGGSDNISFCHLRLGANFFALLNFT